MSINKYTIETRKNIQLDPLYVVILAGGMNYREKKQGVKVLQNFGELSLLEHQLKMVRHTFPKAITSITVGFQAERIIKLCPRDIPIIENQLFEEHNTLEELRLFFNAIKPSRLLLVDGSIYFNEDAIRQVVNSSSLLLYKSDDKQDIGLREENGLVSHLSYGLDDKWSGLAYLEGKELEKLKKVCTRANSRLFLYEGLNLILDHGCKLFSVYSGKAQIVKL